MILNHHPKMNVFGSTQSEIVAHYGGFILTSVSSRNKGRDKDHQLPEMVGLGATSTKPLIIAPRQRDTPFRFFAPYLDKCENSKDEKK